MPKICDKKMTLEECEMSIVKHVVEKGEEDMGRKFINNPEVKQIIDIVEDFIRRKKLICYGGTAINNILPKEEQIYNKEVEFSDYDVFSQHALEDATELADIYASKKQFTNVQAKSGIHHGTYKVYVNFIPTLDITSIPNEVFHSLKKEAINIDGILYCPPNFLRWSMYKELSHPEGDLSRWTKVSHRLNLLNKYYPLKSHRCALTQPKIGKKQEEILEITKNALLKKGVVFVGGYSTTFYSKYLPKEYKSQFEHYSELDVISLDAKNTAEFVKKEIEKAGIDHITLISKDAIGDIIAPHIQVAHGHDVVAFIYQATGCYSYNIVNVNNTDVKIATIDTILSFYLSFLYADKKYYDDERLLCTAQLLFDIQQHHRLSNQGLLKRFSLHCYGHEETLIEIKEKKEIKFKKLHKKDKEYQELFFSYTPKTSTKNPKHQSHKKQTIKKQTTKKQTNKKRKRERRTKKNLKNYHSP